MKFVLAIAVGLVAVGAGVGAAEPERSTPPAREASGSAASAQPTQALLAWIDVCVKNLSSSDEDVRAGAAAALKQAGSAAVPALEKLSAGTSETAKTAKRVLGQIQRASTPPARAAAGEPVRHGPSVDEMSSKLGLAGDQAAKFKTIMEQFHSKQAELSASVKNGDVAVNDAGGKAALLREKTDAELAKLLTPEQMKTYLQMLPSPSPKRASASATR